MSDNKETVFKKSARTPLEMPLAENQTSSPIETHSSCTSDASSSCDSKKTVRQNKRTSKSNGSEDQVKAKKRRRSQIVIQDHIIVIPCKLNTTK